MAKRQATFSGYYLPVDGDNDYGDGVNGLTSGVDTGYFDYIDHIMGRLLVDPTDKDSSFTIDGGVPAGSNTFVQYNDNGAFGANTSFRFSPATQTMTVPVIGVDSIVERQTGQGIELDKFKFNGGKLYLNNQDFGTNGGVLQQINTTSLVYSAGDVSLPAGLDGNILLGLTNNVTNIGLVNTLIGRGILSDNLTTTRFSRNTGFGSDVLRKATDTDSCSAFGQGAMSNITSGYRSNAFGWGAMREAGDPSFCNAFGCNALYSVSDGEYNSAFGELAGLDVTSGDKNSIFGGNAGIGLKTGDNNSIFGFGAGRVSDPNNDNFNDYSNSLILGQNAGSNWDLLTYPELDDGVSLSNRLIMAISNTNAPLLDGRFDLGYVRINDTLVLTDQPYDPYNPNQPTAGTTGLAKIGKGQVYADRGICNDKGVGQYTYVKRYNGTTNNGDTTVIAHGLDATKIESVECIVRTIGGFYISMGHLGNASDQYSVVFDASSLKIEGVGSAIQGQPYKLKVTVRI